MSGQQAKLFGKERLGWHDVLPAPGAHDLQGPGQAECKPLEEESQVSTSPTRHSAEGRGDTLRRHSLLAARCQPGDRADWVSSWLVDMCLLQRQKLTPTHPESILAKRLARTTLVLPRPLFGPHLCDLRQSQIQAWQRIRAAAPPPALGRTQPQQSAGLPASPAPTSSRPPRTHLGDLRRPESPGSAAHQSSCATAS